MTLELRKSETDNINASWQMWTTNDQFELEAIVKNVGLTGFLDVSSRLRAVGLTEETQQPVLNICMPNQMRFSIVGTGPIQSYCKHGDITQVPYNVTIKERIQLAENIDLVDYDTRIKIRREVPVSNTNAHVTEMISKWSRLPKYFRLLNRYTFKGPPNSGFHYDLSLIRESQKDSRGNYIGRDKLTMEDIMKRPIVYEVECELDRDPGSDSLKSSKSFLKGIGLMLQGVQRSYFLVRKPTKESVLSLVATSTGLKNGGFPGPLPSTLELQNIAVENDSRVENIRHLDYNVTDKADGLRCLLVVTNTGKIFLMDSGLNVYGTGLVTDDRSLIGTILDGEWVRTNKNNETVSMYYAFDVYTFGQKKVFNLPFLISNSENHRLANLKFAVDSLTVLRQNNDVPQEHSLKIFMKEFYAMPGSIFENVTSCLENSKTNDYYVDGLIFTPNDKPLPVNGKGWTSQFKWKPSYDNTIDFLVSFEKDENGADKITSEYNALEKTYGKHKTLRLYVGGNQDPAFRDPRDTILYNRVLPQRVDNDSYRPVEFKPASPSDPMASLCNMEISGDSLAIYCTRTKDIISDNCIVEMAYRPENPAGWRWEPIRVRWDKTERFQRGEIARTMNADWVADSIWTSIHNPISENMIRTGVLNNSGTDKPHVYYQKKSVEINNHVIRGHNKFHNEHIKTEILLKSVLKKGNSILDLSCGRGGDILKWIKNDVSWVLGTDINLDCLNAPKTGAYGRYLDLLIKDPKLPPMIFVQADSSKNISTAEAGITPFDNDILLALYGHNPVNETPQYAAALHGLASKQFDVVSSMFSLHYYFKNRESVDGFLTNVSENLKLGGYFVGCCFDGDTVYNKLQRINMGGSINGKEGGQQMWAIRKSYNNDSSVLEPNDSSLGKAIDVFFMSIGEEHREYLVSWKYLVERMGEIGCELLQPNEIAALGLKSSSELFGESYKTTGSKYMMNNALQQFSFMNRWFIFCKRREGAVSEIVIDSTENPFAQKGSGMVIEEINLIVESPIMAEPSIVVAEAPIVSGYEPLPAVEVKKAVPVNGPLYKFYHGSVLKDDLNMGMKSWARYISTFTHSKLKDRDDPKVTYPSLEAAFVSERYKQSTDKPELGPSLFGFTENLHQKYEKQLKNKITEKERYTLLEDEGVEIRNFIKEAKMKQLGATWDEQKWLSAREDVMTYYIQQRYETDPEFKLVLDKLKASNATLVYYNGPRPSDMGGIIRDDGTVDGQNILGNLYMAVATNEP